jgi:hypothetical protein
LLSLFERSLPKIRAMASQDTRDAIFDASMLAFVAALRLAC